MILTSTTGSGHDSVAGALREAICSMGNDGIVVDVVDLLSEGNPRFVGRISRHYAPLIVRSPRLWGLAYTLSNHRAYWQLLRTTIGGSWAGSLVRASRGIIPDLILSVHPLATPVIAESLNRLGWRSQLVTLITDLNEAHAAWVAPGVSSYLAPTDEIRTSLISLGVEAERIEVVGLPLARRFFESFDQVQARRDLGLDQHLFTVLITGGGEGAGAIISAAKAISDARLPVQLILLCGRNETLRRKLEICPLAVPRRVIGFSDDVAQLMEAADVVIGKAGALTIGESLAARRPLIILNPLPGQEKGNAELVCRLGMCAEAEDLSGLLRILERWLQDPGAMATLCSRGSWYRERWSQSATRAAELMLHMMGEGVVRC